MRIHIFEERWCRVPSGFSTLPPGPDLEVQRRLLCPLHPKPAIGVHLIQEEPRLVLGQSMVKQPLRFAFIDCNRFAFILGPVGAHGDEHLCAVAMDNSSIEPPQREKGFVTTYRFSLKIRLIN
eukprot:EG_transcript_20342